MPKMKIISVIIYDLLLGAVPQCHMCTCGVQKTTWDSWFSASTIMCFLRVRLRSPGWHCKHLYCQAFFWQVVIQFFSAFAEIMKCALPMLPWLLHVPSAPWVHESALLTLCSVPLAHGDWPCFFKHQLEHATRDSQWGGDTPRGLVASFHSI